MGAKDTTYNSDHACPKCGSYERLKRTHRCAPCRRTESRIYRQTHREEKQLRRERDKRYRDLATILNREYKIIRDFVRDLLLLARASDRNGRPVGLDYGTILGYVKKKFPVITYPGPHKGKPSTMRIKDLVAIACDLNSNGTKLPVRPRRRSKKGT